MATFYDISFVASSNLTSLAFSFRHDETNWVLDDVSVNVADDPASVPEPGTLALLAGALAALRLTRARRAGPGRGA